jgi:hypothetical protein
MTDENQTPITTTEEEYLANTQETTPAEDGGDVPAETADKGTEPEEPSTVSADEQSATAESDKDTTPIGVVEPTKNVEGNPAKIATHYTPPVKDIKVPQQIQVGRNGKDRISHDEANYTGGVIG